MKLELCYRKLSRFGQDAWYIIERKRRFVPGWHIDCINEHLEAVTYGQIQRLLINMPPRHMKSLNLTFWRDWTWLRLPHWQFLSASYAHNLSIRDNVKARRVVQSDFYKALCERAAERSPETFDMGPIELVGDQNTKGRFENQYGGYNIATSVDGALTGEGGDAIIIDDPNNVREAESDTIREATNMWYDEAMSSRLNGPHGAIIVVQQRTHEADLTGHIIDKYKTDFDMLILPARYEKKVSVTGMGMAVEPKTSLDWEDPREEEGEPLWEARYDDEALTRLEVALGDYAAAGQLQQRPAPREGGMFKVAKLKRVACPTGNVTEVVRYWDKAGTERKKGSSGAATAGALLGRYDDGRFVILDMNKGQWNSADREAEIEATADADEIDWQHKLEIGVEQEPGSGGKESAELTIRRLAGKKCFADRPTGDKAVRAEPMAVQVNAGNVEMVRAEWNYDLIEEMRNFPNSRRKDQVDALAGAFNRICLRKKKKAGVW